MPGDRRVVCMRAVQEGPDADTLPTDMGWRRRTAPAWASFCASMMLDGGCLAAETTARNGRLADRSNPSRGRVVDPRPLVLRQV